MDIRKHAVQPTSTLHIRNANDELLYAEKEDGEPDLEKPVRIVLYGPGSKQYAKAQQVQNNRFVDRLKRKGKSDQTAEEKLREQSDLLVGCTQSFENLEYDGKSGEDLFRAVYSDLSIGFIAEQAGKHLGEWANFSTASTKN